jgi:hypothetical protein
MQSAMNQHLVLELRLKLFDRLRHFQRLQMSRLAMQRLCTRIETAKQVQLITLIRR